MGKHNFITMKRPMVMIGKTYKFKTEMGNLYVTVNGNSNKPLEVLTRIGRSGTSSTAFTEALARVISVSLQNDVKPSIIINQLKGIKSSTPVKQENGEVVYSVPDAIGKALEYFMSQK